MVVLTIIAVVAAAAVVAFMTIGARGNWGFVLSFRGTKLFALILVAYSIAVSTVLFQTITNNRILTPAIMGFDWLYMLLQTLFVFVLGAAATSALDARLMFAIEVGAMLAFSLVLYRFMFSGAVKDLHLLLLIGVVFGTLFRSLSGFLQRLIDPNDFVVLQDRLFASFNGVDSNLLLISTLFVAGASALGLRIFHTFDVMSLGRETAISLGVDHRRVTMTVLAIVTVLVSASAALVGPVTFFGLLVANLAYILMPTGKHRFVLPAAILIAIICLVGGQTILERVFAFDTALSIVIEFAGGLFFIFYLLRGNAR
ncbi:iron chelate uptake ABC transporter family permease subunit [Rhizobium sp. NTR19]|uniref:Iron chelate uptake ABC transporter family permease subunit n=1 Tax=Neorhizobium turbinariae TaxID=2937795 RepID=A0ABT0IPV3_9HYPH|nr:iron chelate uptake ABC transporter family permease subunit [Neorhizobium turbinariae]MCK8779896.1 iron chelate uptake ABC transporter family permease subunit [Neorhizobium turbinariae]